MSRNQDIAFLKSVLTSGIDIVAAMPVLSAPIKRLWPSFSLSLIRVDERAAPMHHYSEYFDETSHRLFAEAGHVYATADDDPAAFATLMKRRRPWGNLVDTSRAYLAGGIYNNLFKRNGIHHVIDAAVRDDVGPLGIVGIFREATAPRFGAQDVALLGELYPWFVHAFAAHRSLVREGPFATARPLLEYDEVDSAMLVASEDGVLRWASPRARVWLEGACAAPELPALYGTPARLPEACRHVCRLWRDGLGRRAASRTSSNRIPTVSLPVPGGRLRLRAYGLSSSSGIDGIDASARLVGIQLSLEVPRALRVLAALEKSTLSPQQRRIAFGLWKGIPPRTLCDEIDIQPSTFKSYQKDLYLRLDVNRLDELVDVLDRQALGLTLDLQRHLPNRDSAHER